MLKDKNIKNKHRFLKIFICLSRKEKYLDGSLNRLFGQGGSTSDGSIFFDKNFFNKDFKESWNSDFEIKTI